MGDVGRLLSADIALMASWKDHPNPCAEPFPYRPLSRGRRRVFDKVASVYATIRPMSVSRSATAQKGAEMTTAQELREAGYAEGMAEAEKAIENGASIASLRRLRENYILRGDATDDSRLYGRADGITEVLHYMVTQ
jgi:hypothetical protein